MSWLKNWFSLFNDNSNDGKQNESNITNQPKEIETKVVYQYPKGKFRFPIEMEDFNNSDLHTSKEQKVNQVDVNKKANIKESNVERRNVARRTPIHQDHSVKNHTSSFNKKSSEKPKYGGRFRPTEVPSPIYGFHQHRTVKKINESVEFELSAFAPPTSILTNKQVEEEVNESVSIEDTELVSSVNDWKRREVHEEKSDENNDENSVQNEEQMELGEISDSIEEDEFIHDGESEHERDSVLDLVRVVELEHEPDVEREYDGDVERDHGSDVHEHDHDFELENKHAVEDKVDNTETSTVEKATSKKKHIPFNVFMLKSDREALQNRRTQQTVLIKDTPSHIHKQIEPIIAETPSENTEQKNNNSNQFQFPIRELLRSPIQHTSNEEWIKEQVQILNRTLQSFNVRAKVVDASEGPSVTRFEIAPELGVKVNKITNLTDDLKLSLAAKDIRIEAPIPGKHTIGIEVPNKVTRPVFLREIIDKEAFNHASSPLTVAIGLDIAGKAILTDLKKMPHGLIAGATGSGKSVCINTFIVSLLYKAKPEEVKLLLIDPKMVELAPYNDIPHLLSPVITDVKAATQALKWAVEEMERRYELFAKAGVRDITRFNEKKRSDEHHLPFIVIIIDELADLMMMSPADVEEAICRIAQKARACGIHLLIATQRPSVDVITGLIKANVPTRIAFSVSSQVDSRTIIDMSGAERLLGKGDMLFLENGTSKPTRLQGAFISDEEIERVVEHVRQQGKPNYLFEQEELIQKSDIAEKDELLLEACEFAVEQGNISTSSLQRHFRIGYNRAARLIELMEDEGMITESKGSKPRDVLITESDLDKLQEYM